MKTSTEIEHFVQRFLKKYEKVSTVEDLRSLRDYVYYEAPQVGDKLPFIEMMSVIWLENQSLLKEPARRDNISYQLLVDIMENFTSRDFQYMREHLSQYTPVTV